MESYLKPEDIKQELCEVVIKEEVSFELIEEQNCIDGIKEESGMINDIKEERACFGPTDVQTFTSDILKEENVIVNLTEKEDLNNINENDDDDFIKDEQEIDYVWPEGDLTETDPLALPEIKYEGEFQNTEEEETVASVSLSESSSSKDAVKHQGQTTTITQSALLIPQSSAIVSDLQILYPFKDRSLTNEHKSQQCEEGQHTGLNAFKIVEPSHSPDIVVDRPSNTPVYVQGIPLDSPAPMDVLLSASTNMKEDLHLNSSTLQESLPLVDPPILGASLFLTSTPPRESLNSNKPDLWDTLTTTTDLNIQDGNCAPLSSSLFSGDSDGSIREYCPRENDASSNTSDTGEDKIATSVTYGYKR